MESNLGYCPNCDEIVDGFFEPDAENYLCPKCEESVAMGIENAVLTGQLN